VSNDSKGGSTRSAIFSGTGWFVFWLFTLGFAKLSFGQAILALVVWPFYLGKALAG
jgi:hypothetical protein